MSPSTSQSQPVLNALGEPVRAAHARLPGDLLSLADYERHAIHHMSADAWHHLQAGSDEQLSVAHNRVAFQALRLLPKPLVDLRQAHTRLNLLGADFSHPILLAPVAYQKLAHPEGELAVARAAAAMHTGWVHSTLASQRMEDVARVADVTSQEMALGAAKAQVATAADVHTSSVPRAPRWFQLYSQPDRAHTLSLLQRAEAAGYQAVVWTVDASFKRSDFVLPAGVDAANLRGLPCQPISAQAGQSGLFGSTLVHTAPTWDELNWLREHTRLPLVVKGVMSPEVALQALAHGADALVVSNHGGRVLDGVPSPLEVLPSIALAVKAQQCGVHVPLLLDSGVRRGTDVLKALALGADAVLIGRPHMHALATGGWLGVAHMLHLLRTELELAMAQTGCATLADVGPHVLWHQA